MNHAKIVMQMHPLMGFVVPMSPDPMQFFMVEISAIFMEFIFIFNL